MVNGKKCWLRWLFSSLHCGEVLFGYILRPLCRDFTVSPLAGGKGNYIFFFPSSAIFLQVLCCSLSFLCFVLCIQIKALLGDNARPLFPPAFITHLLMQGDVAPLSSLLSIPTAGTVSLPSALNKDLQQVWAHQSHPNYIFQITFMMSSSCNSFHSPSSVLNTQALFLCKNGTDKAREEGKYGKTDQHWKQSACRAHLMLYYLARGLLAKTLH